MAVVMGSSGGEEGEGEEVGCRMGREGEERGDRGREGLGGGEGGPRAEGEEVWG